MRLGDRSYPDWISQWFSSSYVAVEIYSQQLAGFINPGAYLCVFVVIHLNDPELKRHFLSIQISCSHLKRNHCYCWTSCSKLLNRSDPCKRKWVHASFPCVWMKNQSYWESFSNTRDSFLVCGCVFSWKRQNCWWTELQFAAGRCLISQYLWTTDIQLVLCCLFQSWAAHVQKHVSHDCCSFLI